MKYLLLLAIAIFQLGCQAPSQKTRSETAKKHPAPTASKIFLNECRDTILNLKAGCSTPEYMDDAVRFRFDKHKIAYASMSKNVQLIAGDSSFVIYGLFPGNGYLKMIGKNGDTIADMTIKIYAPLGWDTLEKRAAEQVAYYSNQCKSCSVDFYPSNSIGMLFRNTLINQIVPDFSMKSLNSKHFHSIEKKDEVSILFIYEYGCQACQQAIAAVKQDSFAVSSAVRLHWFCKDGCYLNGDSLFYYTVRKDTLSESGHPKGVAWAKPSGEIYSASYPLLPKFMISGYPRAYVVDRNGRIRFVSHGASDNMVEMLRSFVKTINVMDIRIAD